MKRAGYLLLEVLVGLALLAVLGVGLLRLQAAATRQLRQARQRAALVHQVDELLFQWSGTGQPVTLPATGAFDEKTTWLRRVQPVRAAGVLATQVSLSVLRHEPGQAPHEAYRVDWLVVPPIEEERH
jgi:type II secretory pathway pseudopilin PulG